MKTIDKYISESIEIEKSSTDLDYCTVVLLRHPNLDCKNMTEDEFVELISNDFKAACKEYDNVIEPYNKAELESEKAFRLKQYTEYAEKHWKRQANRDKYIANMMANTESIYFHPSKIEFFDFDPHQGAESGIPYDCIISNKSTEASLRKCFKELKKAKYFDKATGWAFKYTADQDTLRSGFRPWIDLDLGESARQELEADKKKLEDDMRRFYAGCTYFGD